MIAFLRVWWSGGLKYLELLGLAFFLIVFSGASVVYWSLEYSWLEQQRIAQLLLVFFASSSFVVCFFCVDRFVGLPTNAVLLAIALGLISVSLSQYPEWALKEWAKYVASIALVVYLGGMLSHGSAQQFVLFILLVVSLFLVVQFYAFYVASFFTGTRDVSPYLMYPGFDNPRFYGQYQVLSIPVLHGLSLVKVWSNRLFNKWVIYFVLLLQWSIVWALAGRGVLLSLCGGALVMLLLTGSRYKILLIQIFGMAAVGAALYSLFFFFIPEWAGLARDLPSGLRFDLSRRDVLWLGAWEMVQAHPIFGVGPLHYSAEWNHIGAHPHQATLQFLAEWGVPATALLLFSVIAGMKCGLSRIRNTSDALDAALWLALLASLLLAQVDGVFVMPYTEGWLAVLAGVSWARWRGVTAAIAVERQQKLRGVIFSIFLLLALVVVARILIVEVPQLRETSKAFYQKHNIGSPPRFWDQGWIPM
ncbi:O-antigen ligase family protein [Pseudomonas sp. zjy_9]